jgi:TfoX/Sxy family transcriptional regulator of competence genes
VAYDKELAERIRALMAGEAGLSEKRMFGGLAFLLDGNMAVSASGQGGLLVRVDPAEGETLAQSPHAGAMVMRGRPMEGWMHVDAEGVAGEAELASWVRRGTRYARSLPPKVKA